MGKERQINESGTIHHSIIKILIIVTALFMVAVICGLFVQEGVLFQKWDIILFPIAALLVAGIIYCIWKVSDSKKIASRTILVGILMIGTAIRTWYVLSVPGIPESSWKLVLQVSWMTAQGDLSWVNAQYFKNFAFFIPFVYYQAGVLSVLPSVWALKFCNLFWILGSNYLLYRIARELTSEKTALVATALYALYPEVTNLAPVLMNGHIATFFFLLALFVMLRCRTKLGFFVAGILFGISNMMRPIVIITMIAVICVMIAIIISNKNRAEKQSLLVSFALLLLGYFFITEGTELLLKTIGIAPFGISNNVPEWKFLLGLDSAGRGLWREEYYYVLGMDDPGLRRKEVGKLIINSWKNGGNPVIFFGGKVFVQWCYYIRSELQCVDHLAWVLNAVILLLVWVMSLLSLRNLKKNDTYTVFQFLMVLIFLGDFLIYLLIEVSPRYRYNTMPIMFILASTALAEWIGKRRKPVRDEIVLSES